LEGKDEYEIAYALLPKFWKKGYGTELARHMKAYGFHNLKTERLISIIEKNNIDSIKVALRNNMQVLFETNYLGMEVQVFGITK